MRKWLAFFLILTLPTMVLAQTFDLSGYQEPNGAITVGYGGDRVDPYFSTKALLTALDGGLDIRPAATKWIRWAISMQRPDGLFERYARDPSGNWQRYAIADADDAVLAIWLELLYRMAPASGLPKSWQDSADKAEAQLELLHDQKQGIYHISTTLPVGLLMDNVEIYSAFRNIAREQTRMNLKSKAGITNDKAAQLKQGILKVFKEPTTGRFLVSTQPRSEVAFYPDQAAQIFPLLYQLQPGDTANAVYRNWMKVNGKEWLKQRTHDYPWGLVAITAMDMNDPGSASCWVNSAEPMRYSKQWNVLEEAAYQQVKWRLRASKDLAIPCVGKDLL